MPPTFAPSSNTFQDFLLTRFHSDFLKGHNSRKRHNSEKKKHTVSYFSWGIHIWNFKTLPCTVHKIWHALIRAVAEQHSSPELNQYIWSTQKHELKIARVWGCSIFWPAAPLHGMYPGVSIYGMEADPPRFLYLKDECFHMTDSCDIDISLIMKNSKSVTLTSRSVRRWGGGGDGTA